MSPTAETRKLYESMQNAQLRFLREAFTQDVTHANSTSTSRMFVAQRIALIDEILAERECEA